MNKFYPSEEKQQEIVETIQAWIESGASDFKEYFDSQQGVGLIVLQFYMMPKTDLHKEFDRVVLAPLREESRASDEQKFISEMIRDVQIAKDSEEEYEEYWFRVRGNFTIWEVRHATLSMFYYVMERWMMKSFPKFTRLINEKDHKKLRTKYMKRA